MKRPFLVILVLFSLAYLVVGQFSSNRLSDEPVVLTKNNPPEIVMFGSQTCLYCIEARRFFEKHNLPYVENDIDTSNKHREMFTILGGKGTPLIIVNREIIHGFEESLVRDAL